MLARRAAAILVLGHRIQPLTCMRGQLYSDSPETRLHHHDLAIQNQPLLFPTPHAQRRCLAKQQRSQRIGILRTTQHRQQRAQTAFLHRGRHGHRVERTVFERQLQRMRQQLRRSIVHRALQNCHRIGCKSRRRVLRFANSRAQTQAHHIGKSLRIARSRAIPYRLRCKNRLTFKTAIQRPQQRRARGRDCFTLRPGRVYRHAAQQLCRRRSRHRKLSMRTIDKSAAYIHWRGIPLGDALFCAQPRQPHRRAHNVGDGVHVAHLVEVHILHRHAVNLRFRLRQQRKSAQRKLPRILSQRSLCNQRANLLPRPPMRMIVFMLMLVRMAMAVMIVRVVVIRMRLFVAVRVTTMTGIVLMVMHMLRQLFASVHVHLRRANPATIHRADLQRCADLQLRGCLFQQRRRNARIEQRAQHHVAGETGKAFQISNFHRDPDPILSVKGSQPCSRPAVSTATGSSSFIEPERYPSQSTAT